MSAREWAGWRVVTTGADGFQVFAPNGHHRAAGCASKPLSPRDLDGIIWGAAVGHHDSLQAADPARYAYWRQDDAYDEEAMQSLPSSRSVDAPVLPPSLEIRPENAISPSVSSDLSPAKVVETSETGEIQAGNGAGLIMELLLPVSDSPQAAVGQAVTPDPLTAKVIPQEATTTAPGADAPAMANVRIQA